MKHYRLGDIELFSSVPECVALGMKLKDMGYEVAYYHYCNDRYYGLKIIREPERKKDND